MPIEETAVGKPKYGSEPFYPHHLLRQAIQLVALFAILVFLASAFPPSMHPKANTFDQPAQVKPDWIFLSAYQFLKLADRLSFMGAWAPKVLGILAQGLGAMAIWFLPFWDPNPERHPARRPTAIRMGICVVFFFLIMTLWGHFS